MTEQLRERLQGAVPDPPPLRELADRAVMAAVRRRRATRLAVASGLVAVMAVAGGLYPWPGGDPDPAPTASDTPCVTGAEVVHTSESAADVVAVRFCGRDDGVTGGVRFPEGTLTGPPAARFVADWPQKGESCERFGGRDWRVQVTLASGDVVERRGNTEFCGDAAAYRQLAEQIGQQLAFRYPGVEPNALEVACPAGLRLGSTDADGPSAELLSGSTRAAALSTTPLLALPAVDGYVCRYSGTGRERRLEDSWRVLGETAQQIHLEATLGYQDGMADCAGDPGAESFLVVLRDQTGTARSFTVDPTECSPMSATIGRPAEEQYLGLALPALVSLISGTQT